MVIATASVIGGCGLFAPFEEPAPAKDAAADGPVDASGVDGGAGEGGTDAAADGARLDAAVTPDAAEPCQVIIGALSGDELSSPANVLAIEGERVVLGERTTGIAVVDVSDPSAPLLVREVATIPEPAEPDDPRGEIRDIALDGDLAVVTELEAGLAVVDLETGSHDLVWPAEIEGGRPHGVALRDDFRAVVAWGDAGIAYLDLDPDGPVVAPRLLDLPGDGGAVEIALGPSHAYVALLEEIRVVSLPPDDLVQVEALAVGQPGDDVREIVLGPKAPRAYAAVEPIGLVVVSVEDPTDLAVIGVAATTSQEGPRHLALWDDHAVVAAVSVLEIFDVSTPEAPVLAATWEPTAPATAAGVAVSGDLAYVASGDGGLEVLDLACIVR